MPRAAVRANREPTIPLAGIARNNGVSELLLITGGRQRRDAFTRDEWFAYDLAILATANPETGEVTQVFSYASPPEFRPARTPAIVFKSGSLSGSIFAACTQTEVLLIDVPEFSVLEIFSLPFFNDLHHVHRVPDGRLLVAVTGLDMVVELSADGKPQREWSAGGPPTWERFSMDIDYRRWHTTKPHLVHPNHVFTIDDDVWVTRFEQRDAVRLTSHPRRISIDIERPHDGIVDGADIYFTTVDGHICVADAQSSRVTRVIDLNTISGGGAPLGWCRGIHVGPSSAWVGFSRIRATTARRNLSWVRHGFKQVDAHRVRPTRIAEYDLKSERLLREVDLEPAELSCVFSIHSIGTG